MPWAKVFAQPLRMIGLYFILRITERTWSVMTTTDMAKGSK
jgi:hypothetical protein